MRNCNVCPYKLPNKNEKLLQFFLFTINEKKKLKQMSEPTNFD